MILAQNSVWHLGWSLLFELEDSIIVTPLSPVPNFRKRKNLTGSLAPQKQADGSLGWALPLDPNVRVIHTGDITELGYIVVGAFAHPDQAGNGEHLPLTGSE
jgi:hypothetical protein